MWVNAPYLACHRMRRTAPLVECLSFATLTVFLHKICAFDFTLAKTRLSLRRTTGADGQSFWCDYRMGLETWETTNQASEYRRQRQTRSKPRQWSEERSSQKPQNHQIADSWPGTRL